MTELRSKPTLSVDIGAATQFSTEALYNSPAAYPANSPKYPVVYTALRVRADSTVIRPGEEGDGRTTEDRQVLYVLPWAEAGVLRERVRDQQGQ